jgi:hypothetical protein
MPTIDGGRIVVTLEGRDVSLGQLLTRIEGQMQSGIVQARNYDTTLAQVSATQARQEASTLAYAQSLARGAAATGDFAGAQRILASALQQVTPNTTAASNAVNQLQTTIQKASIAQTEQNSVFSNAAQGFNKLIGAYFAVSTAAQAFGAVINQGNELEKQQAVLKGLSGNMENYEKNLAAAKAQQDKFGGSLEDNIEGIANFANLSNRTGIEISKLTELARGLATVDPAQGFKGAGIALKEFFSGDITSLARRFEIPRDELNAIKDIADQGQRLQALEAVLAKFGVTQELISAQANTTAVAYEKLSGAASDAVASIGQALGQALKPAVETLTADLQETASGLHSLSTAGDQMQNITAGFINASTTVEDFNTRIAGANDEVGKGLGNFGLLAFHFQTLSQEEFNFAKASLEAGNSIKDTKAAIDALTDPMNQLEGIFGTFPEKLNTTSEGLHNYEQAAFTAAVTSKEGATLVTAMTEQILDNKISVADATVALQNWIFAIASSNAQSQQQANASQLASQALAVQSTELGKNAIEAQNASIATDTLKSLQAELANLGGAVAAGHISAANAALQLAHDYGIATAEAERLINAQARLAGITASTAATAKRRGQEGGLLGELGSDTSKAATSLAFLQAQKKRNEELLQSEINLARARGDSKRAVDLLRQSQKGLNKDSAEFKNIEAQIIGLESQKAKGGKKAAKSPKLSENEKLNNQLLAQQDKFDNQMEDAEAKHQENLLKILQDAAKKQLATEKENEVLKRRSRFDFYSNLNKSTISPIDREKFAAQYEEAFAEAQKIAQSGRAKLAQEFLDLRKRQIEELQQLAQEEQEIKDDKDLSKGEKDKRLAELEARRKLLLEAQEEERKQLLEGGDKNVNELNDRIAEENKAYDDQVEKIANAANRAADAKVTAAERSKKAVSDENKELAAQVGLLDQINQKNAGRPTVPTDTSGLPTNNTPASSTPVSATDPLPVKTDGSPLPIAAPEAITVKQFELFLVRDQGVIDALGDQTIRLESKLDTIATAIGMLGTDLGGRIDNVRNAIGAIRSVRP